MVVFVQWGLMLLGILGAVQLWELLSIWFCRPQKVPSIFSVIALDGELQNPEQLLKYFQEAAVWSPECQLAFVIDCGLSKKSADECREWCKGKSRLIFCTQKEFSDICKGIKDKVY